jgi:MFS family permease
VRKLYNKYSWVFKLVLSSLVILVLYQQIVGRADFPKLLDEFQEHLRYQNAGWLIAALLLVPVNWSLETQKWRELMHRLEPIPFWRAFQAVLAGIAFSIITPNRIGEYGGRVLMVRIADKWQTVVATLVGSFSQMVVLLSAGAGGAAFFVAQYFHLKTMYSIGLGLTVVIASLILLFFYYNIDLAIPIVRRLPYLQRGVKHLEVLREYTRKQLNNVLLYSALRYAVYSIQYYLLLLFFGIKIHILTAFTTIAFIFFVQTAVPALPGASLPLRAEVARLVWSDYTQNPLTIFAVSFGLWAMNVAIPALIGMVFIINVNVDDWQIEKKR